ncbi:FAD:protein FMN transferase [Sphingomonas sp.]|uniref:FAD:protein FMN transferase n=1 Tax=Sphingomonas sp. TaxID=28214 RepID=UPI003B3A3C01
MGTVWRVSLAAPVGFDTAALRTAIVARLDAIIGEMSHWDAGSWLGRFNTLQPGRWMALPPDFATVIATGLTAATRLGGAFDPAIGALVDLWGFGPPGPRPHPDEAEIAAARACSGWQRLAYDPAARRLLQPGGLRLDLSGIAKGFAVDALATLIARQGHGHFLVEIGGELAGRGMRPDGDPWWVELETPGDGLAPIRVALHQLAVATSGDYVRGAHTIDPRSGHPAQAGVVAVSVLHASAMWADVWASALAVLGADDGLRLAADEGLAARIVTRAEDGLHETISPALAAML